MAAVSLPGSRLTPQIPGITRLSPLPPPKRDVWPPSPQVQFFIWKKSSLGLCNYLSHTHKQGTLSRLMHSNPLCLCVGGSLCLARTACWLNVHTYRSRRGPELGRSGCQVPAESTGGPRARGPGYYISCWLITIEAGF